MLSSTVPALVLAPMEGVTDAAMRALQGQCGAFSYAVSEFLRVSHSVPPKSVFLRHVPEFKTQSRTATHLPVQVQILGGDAGRMAESSVVAHAAGATAIDINFGCPAKTVNRHDGGATLLKYPTRIREIVAAVRAALPITVPVSAKLRLGWDSIEPIFENALMAEQGGASWITIHARTRDAGYQPPVFWKTVGQVRESLSIPVIANGDIWTLDDFHRCRDETGCTHFMIGRGALADPRLAYRIACVLGSVLPDGRDPNEPIDWSMKMSNLVIWSHQFEENRPERIVRRLKQWLKLAATHGSFRQFDFIKQARTPQELIEGLRSTG